MHLTKTKFLPYIKKIITNPVLWKLEYGQGMNIEEYDVDYNFDYLLIEEDGVVMGLFQTKELTRILLEAHIYLLPEFWGSDNSKKALEALFTYVRDNTTYHKVFTDVPASCSHVINLMGKAGAKCCGLISEGVIYDGKLQDLLLFDKKIERGV